MKKIAIAAGLCLVVGLAFAPTVNAAEGDQPNKGPDPNFDQRKERLLKMIDARITRIEQVKSCVQKATNRDEVKACMPAHDGGMQKRREGGGKQGGPGTP